MIGVNLKGDRFGQVQAEDAQDGLAIHHVTAYAEIDVVGITIGNVHEGLDIFRQAQFDIHGFHRFRLLTYSHSPGSNSPVFISITPEHEGCKYFVPINEHLIVPVFHILWEVIIHPCARTTIPASQTA